MPTYFTKEHEWVRVEGDAATVGISTLTVANGFTAGSGGGIDNGGTLTLTNCTLSGNTAGTGGGLAHGGTLMLSNTTFSGNSAAGFGGDDFQRRHSDCARRRRSGYRRGRSGATQVG